ncbi:UPF0280 family protein [Methanocella sp. CWC-04]|uniref:UPF0280 protein CUJ83_06010 n=1 Tax=Methanooceanicella nereidis TaxID=2052831 RepID=A0AAP2W4P4_9EURY|nr:UPF0280 family protein [Methanocella sp. CWC-04]MCD1294555.1 UPF0280 family protein [Methanocella sp. CWC-04]
MRKTAKYQIKETIVTVIAAEKYHDVCMASIRRSRAELEQYILKDPYFKVTFDPYHCDAGAPEVVKRMADASRIAGVGPMAAVAGTIAWIAVEDMVKAGASFALVDNGGDIAVINDEPVLAGIYAGESPIKGLALEIPGRDTILGICTSAGTVGPSISLGNSDAAMVISENVSLADASATALGNRIVDSTSLESAFDFLKGMPEIQGALGIIGDKMATYGRLPKIVRARVDYEKITRGD